MIEIGVPAGTSIIPMFGHYIPSIYVSKAIELGVAGAAGMKLFIGFSEVGMFLDGRKELGEETGNKFYDGMKDKDMVINLTQSVPLKQLCRISAIGHTTDIAKQVEFTFSHEAIIGFATELLWMYEDINDSKKLIITTNQLQVDPAPNQAIGFYLTPNSPLLVIKINSLMEKECECNNWKEIRIKEKNVNQFYKVKSSFDDDDLFTIESYELSKKNIISIKLSNDEGDDVTNKFSTVIFEINRSGIKELATMLLVWANNCINGDEYILPHNGKSEIGYNLGVVLTHDSISTKFKCHDLGAAHDYDSRI